MHISYLGGEGHSMSSVGPGHLLTAVHHEFIMVEWLITFIYGCGKFWLGPQELYRTNKIS